jgi:hypothetical protein
MNNYHAVMSRFQVSAPLVGSLGFAGAPLPSQMVYSASPSIPQLGAPSIPQLGTAPSPLIPQTGAPPFATSAHPLFSATAANLAAMDLKLRTNSQPAGEIVAPPVASEGTTQISDPSTPEPTGPEKTQSPETPSKRTSMKSIESYFSSVRKPTFPVSIEEAIPAIPKPSPHDPVSQFTEGDKERAPPRGIPSQYSEDLSTSREEVYLSPFENGKQGQEGLTVGDHQADWL